MTGVEQLIQEGPRPSDITELEKWSYLHRALIGPGGAPPPEMIRRLLAWGVEVDGTDMYGNTPLHYAVRQKAPPQIVRILLEAGANVNARNRDGTSLLNIALAFNPINHEVVAALLDGGADMHLKNSEGRSILDQVAARAAQDPETYRIFTEHQQRKIH